MESILKRILGTYFVASALQYVPAALYTLGVQSPAGPHWVFVAVPLLQGLATAAAGFWLLRTPGSYDATTMAQLFRDVETLVQLFGMYFTVNGVVRIATPFSGLLFFNEDWGIYAGGSVASALTLILIGVYLMVRPGALSALFKRHTAA